MSNATSISVPLSGLDAESKAALFAKQVLGFALAFGLVGVTHVVGVFCWSTLGPATHMIFLAGVVIASLYGGYGPGLLATVLAGADLTYCFIPPYYSFRLNIDELIFVITFVAVALLISSLQARRRSAEASLRRAHDGLEARVRDRTAELVRSQQQLRLLVGDLLTIAERERQRIGRDLHDDLGQHLTGVALLTGALAERLRGGQVPAPDDADRIESLVRQSIGHTRDLARGLCPMDLEDEGLPAALGRMAEQVSRLPGVRCSFRGDGVAALDRRAAMHLYRIAQEAINNALRHGRAKSIDVTLRQDDARWTMAVRDDGIGFDPAALDAAAPAGMGLRLMRHRADTLGAFVRVRPLSPGVEVECSGGPSL